MALKLDPKEVAASESIDRFVFKRQVREDGVVRRDAFSVPSSGPHIGKLSVDRTDGCSLGDLWAIYVEFVEKTRPGALGSAKFPAAAAIEESLSFIPDEDHQGRHANIVGWPLALDQKDRLKVVKQALADRANFVRRPIVPSP